MTRVRDLLTREPAKDTEFLEAVDRLVALDEAEKKRDNTLVGEVRKVLTPRQQAKFLLFRQRFRQWLENRMRDARELRGRRGGRRFVPDVGPEGDDDSQPVAPDRQER